MGVFTWIRSRYWHGRGGATQPSVVAVFTVATACTSGLILF